MVLCYQCGKQPKWRCYSCLKPTCGSCLYGYLLYNNDTVTLCSPRCWFQFEHKEKKEREELADVEDIGSEDSERSEEESSMGTDTEDFISVDDDVD